MKSFIVLAGMDKDNLKEILHASLKHDGNAEVFDVGWREGGEGGLVRRSSFFVASFFCQTLILFRTDVDFSLCQRDTSSEFRCLEFVIRSSSN